MKKLLLYHFVLLGIAMAVILAACKSGETKQENVEPAEEPQEEKKPLITAEEVCTEDTKIAMTIKNYGYGMSGEYEYIDTNFTIKQSHWKIINDSIAELKLCNYKLEELVGDRKDDQLDIMVEFRAKNGKKLEIGSYAYQEYSEDLNSSVTLVTSKGTVYFNWVMGMPEQGDVTIDYYDKKSVCGVFTLNVEKPDNDMIGIVRLNGTFRVIK